MSKSVSIAALLVKRESIAAVGAAVAMLLSVPSLVRAQGQQATAVCEQFSDKVNFASRWSGWTESMRLLYIDGFSEGQSSTYLAVYNDLSAARREQVRKGTFVFYESAVLSAVMTDLYRDPANVYIRTGTMIYIARDKLRGMDIEPMLRRSRQQDCGLTQWPTTP